MESLLYWIDLETTGLKAECPILEVAATVTDCEMNILDEVSFPVWGGAQETAFLALPRDDWAHQTHTRSGLISECIREGQRAHVVERQVIAFLEAHGIDKKDPLCGASVHADRTWLVEQMPDLVGQFSYRNIDVSSFKEVCRRLNPYMWSSMDDDVAQQLADAYGEEYGHGVAHRGMKDLRWTIGEMRWYKDNFLFVSDPLRV